MAVVEKPLEGKIAFFTGATRIKNSINGPAAVELARLGATIVSPHLGEVDPRYANEVVEAVEAVGGKMVTIKADLTKPADRVSAIKQAVDSFGQIDLLIHGAALGINPNYTIYDATVLNADAVEDLTELALPYMPRGGKVLAEPSIGSWFYDRIAQIEGYENVASSKHDGETRLKDMIPYFDEKGISLGFAVGHAIEGTRAVSLLRRKDPAKFKSEIESTAIGGKLPTIKEMVDGIVWLAVNDFPQGHAEYIGIPHWDEEETARYFGFYGESKRRITSVVFPDQKTAISTWVIKPEHFENPVPWELVPDDEHGQKGHLKVSADLVDGHMGIMRGVDLIRFAIDTQKRRTPTPTGTVLILDAITGPVDFKGMVKPDDDIYTYPTTESSLGWGSNLVVVNQDGKEVATIKGVNLVQINDGLIDGLTIEQTEQAVMELLEPAAQAAIALQFKKLLDEGKNPEELRMLYMGIDSVEAIFDVAPENVIEIQATAAESQDRRIQKADVSIRVDDEIAQIVTGVTGRMVRSAVLERGQQNPS